MERLLQNLDYENNRFLFLYGKGVDDRFLSTDYRDQNILECLWIILKAKKFECILFFSHTERVFFLDSNSQQYCRVPGGKGDTKAQIEPGKMRFFKGPMGKNLNKSLSTHLPEASTEANLGNQKFVNSITDGNALKLMDWLMRDTSRRTAVVIDQAETSFHYFAQLGAQAGKVGSWVRLPLSNHNICIMLFARTNLSKKVTEQAEFLPIPELITYLENCNNKSNRACLEVPAPEETEALRLLNYTRLVQKIPIVWGDRQRMTELITADGRSGREWLQILSSLPKLDTVSISRLVDPNSGSSMLTWRERLAHLEGLGAVKKHLLELEAYLRDRRERKQNGMISEFEQPPALHLAFLGNPGTGKTTVARLIGAMYRDLGLLKKGHTIAIEYKDLISEHVGGTVAQTDELVDKALDGVLFIDEAYQLAEESRGGFGQEAIDRLLTRMENDRERLVVIVAGYTGKMQKFLQSNPGLTSRFPLDNRIIFPDYKPPELMNILRGFLAAKGLAGASDAFTRSIQEVIENMYIERDEETFGNARKMRELADSIEMMRAMRRANQGDLPANVELEPTDISPAYNTYRLPTIPKLDVLLSDLNGLVGLAEVKEMVTDLSYHLRANKRRIELGQKVNKPVLNMLFIGNPGTGKTTVARMLGKIFQAVGVLHKGHVHEIRAGDLIAGYVGQTAIKAKELMKEALDGVLFIDEAYELTPGGTSDTFKTEALGVLMEYMDRYSNRLVVIMAGYPKKMSELVNSNPGLPRRFPLNFMFADYSDDDLLEILRRKTASMGILLSTSVLPRARAYLQEIRKQRGINFGNAGEVDILIDKMMGSQARRLEITNDDRVLITFEPDYVPINHGSNIPGANSQEYLHYDLASRLPEPGEVQNIQQAMAAVGLLHVKNMSGEGTGTGFVVTPHGHVLTAYHVVQGAQQVSFRLDGTEKELDAEVVGLDEKADLAILRLPSGLAYPYVSLAEAGYTPSIGQDVVVMGYPLGEQFGQEITFTDGVVSSLRDKNWKIQISAPVTHGSSGGPVFHKTDMRVIGAIHGGAQEAGAMMNFACNAQLVYLRFGLKSVSE